MELIVSLSIMATVLLIVFNIFSLAVKSTAYSEEYIRLNLLVKEKSEFIKSQGFWVKDVDTSQPAFPLNKDDLAVIWKNDLAKMGYTKKALIDTTFLKYQSQELVNFNGQDFDGDEQRNKVKINMTLFDAQDNPITQTMVLCLYPSEKKLKAVLSIIKNALDVYYNENSAYPNSGNLAALVPNYLIEIPSDPYTEEKQKLSHTEEATDWYYTNEGSIITLIPNSHIEDENFKKSWTYP